MTAPVEPNILEEIRESFTTDLSWVTFADENPTEECKFYECGSNADWLLIALPCGHEYPFCDPHTQHTRRLLSKYMMLTCSQCGKLITDIKYEPIKRG